MTSILKNPTIERLTKVDTSILRKLFLKQFPYSIVRQKINKASYVFAIFILQKCV